MNHLAEIFWAIKEPEIGLMLDTPVDTDEWKRFFRVMNGLENKQVVQFQNGRYLLHPKRKVNVVAQAEAVLAEISKPLTLDEPVVAPVVVVPAPLMLQFNVCQTCKGKGRVNIQDALGFFGSFMCLTCYGEGQLPVPSRSTFPPVDLSVKPSSPNALLFSSNAAPVAIPQALEVGGVHVIVEAPLAAELVASNSDCDTCEGYGTLVINNIEQTCTVCNGTGEKPEAVVVETPVVDSPSSELIATLAPLAAIALGDTQVFDAVEVPALVAADCLTCTGSGMAFDTLSEAPYIRVQSCSDCGGSGEMQELPLLDVFPDSPSDEKLPEVVEPIDAMGDGGFVWHDKLQTDIPVLSIPAPSAIEAAEAIVEIIAPVIAAPSKSEIEAELAQIAQHEALLAAIETSDAVKKERVILKTYPRGTRYVRVDWSKRGLSSGRFEILSIMRQYGRTWWMVTLWHVDKAGNPYPYQFPVAPDTKRIEMVVG
jgi:hypothetical protein